MSFLCYEAWTPGLPSCDICTELLLASLEECGLLRKSFDRRVPLALPSPQRMGAALGRHQPSALSSSVDLQGTGRFPPGLGDTSSHLAGIMLRDREHLLGTEMKSAHAWTPGPNWHCVLTPHVLGGGSGAGVRNRGLCAGDSVHRSPWSLPASTSSAPTCQNIAHVLGGGLQRTGPSIAPCHPLCCPRPRPRFSLPRPSSGIGWSSPWCSLEAPWSG